MDRCVIIGGADIGNYERIKQYVKQDDFFIYCDSGLKHMEKLNAKPNLIVGDFDSHHNPNLPIETIVLPCEKDDTDTVFAVKTAISRGFANFILIGVVGGRLDHTLGNISILLMLNSLGKKAIMIDDFSETTIVSDKTEVTDECKFFSLLNISGTAKGINIKDAKYNVENAEITCEYPYGISNEPLAGKVATITIKEGRMLLVKS